MLRWPFLILFAVMILFQSNIGINVHFLKKVFHDTMWSQMLRWPFFILSAVMNLFQSNIGINGFFLKKVQKILLIFAHFIFCHHIV